jgi:peptide deformylase
MRSKSVRVGLGSVRASAFGFLSDFGLRLSVFFSGPSHVTRHLPMILEVVKYGHPALRQRGARIEKVTLEIKKLIADMVETMHTNHGIGLAAQQVGQALQLTVIDVREAKDRPSWLELDGKPGPVNEFMPLVLINPEIKPGGEPVAGGEGCLSFPEIYAEITRPESVDVKALNEKGKPVEFRCGGLLARVVQHETDHLNGILFIDRMSRKTKEELRPELDELQAKTKAELESAGKR